MDGPVASDPQRIAEGVLAGDLRTVSRTITLVESTRPDDVARAEQVLEILLPRRGEALRLGVTGTPGVGKSTLIDALGSLMVEQGRRVAVLAVDPSSGRRGGSILGDKTRMGRLNRCPGALVRPSPSGSTVGGVASRTREAMVVCEAAGYDPLIVETVGIGQTDAAVAGMVDFFLLLVSPEAGDFLQSIKRGVLEHADAVAVTRADGATEAAAGRMRADYETALRLLASDSSDWRAPVLALSAPTGRGVEELLEVVLERHRRLAGSGELAARRRAQERAWMDKLVEEGLSRRRAADPGWRRRLDQALAELDARRITAVAAARRMLEEP